MSLADKFQEYFGKTEGLDIPLHIQHAVEQAFYAGAEATLNYCNLTSPRAMQMVEHEEIQAEIDHFRSHK